MGATKKSSKKRSRKSSTKSRFSSKKRVHVVPGYTRIGGAYGRSIPCGPEKKFKDLNIEGVNVLAVYPGSVTSSTTPTTGANNSTGAIFLTIAQGSGENQRVGNKICVTNFNFKGVLQVNSRATTTGCRVRYMFVWDMQANGAVFTAANLLNVDAGATANAQSTMLVNAFRELDEVARFKVIKDKTVFLNPVATNAGTIATHEIPLKCSWKGEQVVHYSGANGTIGELRSANLALLIFADEADTAASYSGVGRVKFTDQ